MKEEKKCFKCERTFSIDEFYTHSKMPDGHLNKCKHCTKNDVSTREKMLRLDPVWVKNERERSREKYYRLNYKGKNKPTTEKKKEATKRYRQKFPEKYLAAKYTEIFLTKLTGFNLHHWSYNQEDWLDVIQLTVNDHNFLHRHIIYLQEKMVYLTLDGEILNSRKKHEDYFKLLKENEN